MPFLAEISGASSAGMQIMSSISALTLSASIKGSSESEEQASKLYEETKIYTPDGTLLEAEITVGEDDKTVKADIHWDTKKKDEVQDESDDEDKDDMSEDDSQDTDSTSDDDEKKDEEEDMEENDD